MSFLRRVRIVVKKMSLFVVLLMQRGTFKGVVLSKLLYLYYIHKNHIKVFYLHYNLFTPKLRFIYSVKRLFAYCFNKAPTLFFKHYDLWSFLNSILLKYIVVLTQVLKNRTLALIWRVYSLKGGVIC